MRYFLVIISVALVAVAGCSMSGGTGGDDTDLSVVREKVDCKLEPFNPACAEGAGGEEIIPEDEDDGDGEIVNTPSGFSVTGGNKTITVEKNTPIQIPFSIVEGTGKGPFLWSFDGLWAGATITASGAGYRQATISWTPAEYKKVIFTVMVSDQGQPSLAPRTIKVGVLVNEPVEISAIYHGGPLDGYYVQKEKTGDRSYRAKDPVDLRKVGSDSVWLRLSVGNLTKGGGYEFKTANTRFKISGSICTGTVCEAFVEPKYYTQDLTNVSFTVTSKGTGYSSTLSIPKVKIVPEGYLPEDNPDACKDGIDNDKDGIIDCKDTDCQWIYPCREKENTNAMCNPEDKVDGVPFDNDGDGLANCDDPDCNSIYVTVCRSFINPIAMAVTSAHVEITGYSGYYDPYEANNLKIRFCKDRDVVEYALKDNPTSDEKAKINKECTDIFNWGVPPVDGKAKSKTVTSLFSGKENPGEYLNYIAIKGSMGGYTESCGLFGAADCYYEYWWWFQSIKVTYSLFGDPKLLNGEDARISYWNPCVNRSSQSWNVQFGKNDTAMCVIAKHASGGGVDNTFKLSVSKTSFEDVEDAPAYGFDSKTETSDILSLLLGLDTAEKIKKTSGYIFDCNPFNKDSCSKQRASFDSSRTRPKFDMSGRTATINVNVEDEWTFDWYQAFIFQPGYAWYYSQGKNYVDMNSIYFAYDENDSAEAVKKGTESRKCQLKTSNTLWNKDKFERMAREEGVLPDNFADYCY